MPLYADGESLGIDDRNRLDRPVFGDRFHLQPRRHFGNRLAVQRVDAHFARPDDAGNTGSFLHENALAYRIHRVAIDAVWLAVIPDAGLLVDFARKRSAERDVELL